MVEVSRTQLYKKLNKMCDDAVRSAYAFSKMRGHAHVEIAHWLDRLFDQQNTDCHRILEHFEVQDARLSSHLTQAIDRLARGGTGTRPVFSENLHRAVEEAWKFASLYFMETRIRSGHILIALLNDNMLRAMLYDISGEFEKIKVDVLVDQFDYIAGSSAEETLREQDAAFPTHEQSAEGGAGPAAGGDQEALARFSVDLTAKARDGELDPIVGRDSEIRQIVDILMRRRQNNPILTGEAGVGKTAVVEGFAQRIARGDVPPSLKNVTLRTLDLGLLQAGASVKGEFENRLRQVIEEVQSSPQPIILFIDEAHTLIGAGGASGQGDAANLLKPALARGALRTIAATTWAEYKKYFEKDAALTRRFQVVQVDEPGEEKAILMMRGLTSTMEDHHKVQILDEAIESSVSLSHRYIPARQLPDKSVSLLDTACARVAISQYAVPAKVDDCRKAIDALETERQIIARESAIGIDTTERDAKATEKIEEAKILLVKLEKRWETEKQLVDKILELRAKLRGVVSKVEGTNSELEKSADDAAKTTSVETNSNDDAVSADEETLTAEQREKLYQELGQLQVELDELQGDQPLILPHVGSDAIASVISDWTGIPVGRMVSDEVQTILNLAEIMSKRIVGQQHALEMITRRIQTSRAGLDNPGKPIGVFMLAGPSGVGKTETALALAEALYGGEQNIITINMSEFQEAHTVSTLKGAPPGYIGYGEGGVLTEAVRRKPYSIVLLDEVEKAHPDVHEIFFQVFDKGQMEDGEGRRIDFKNTIILLTTNAGSDLIMNMCKDPELIPDSDGLTRALREPLLKVFPPALLGRIVTIPYYPLSDEMLATIIKLQIGRIQKRVEENHNIPLTYEDEVIKLIADRCTELESGGRMVDAILTNTMLPEISNELLARVMSGRDVTKVHISVENSEFLYAFD